MSPNSLIPTLVLGILLGSTASAQRTVRVNVSTSGAAPNGFTHAGGISRDGRFVLFSSAATNLVSNDTNGHWDLFRSDRWTGETIRVTVSSAGAEADGDTLFGSISADGRFVVFASAATNLVSNDTNGKSDIFLRDVGLGQTTRVSESATGVQADDNSSDAMISADGRYVAFTSHATNLVPGDTNGEADVFVRDLATGQIERASVDSSGAEGNGESSAGVLSPDGRYVAFTSEASNLAAGDTNGAYDAFLHDRTTGTTKLVSVSLSGSSGNGDSGGGTMSDDGRYVAFTSYASDLVASDYNGYSDVFVRDMVGGRTVLATLSTSGLHADASTYYGPSISGDGRSVAFNSTASYLVYPDYNAANDVFVRDLGAGVTTRESVNTDGVQANADCYSVSMSADARFVAFKGTATNLVENDGNGFSDLFVRDRGSKQATLFCGAEQLGALCPCQNAGGAQRGCDNSRSTFGAYLTDFGQASLSADTLVIVASGATADSRSILVQGTAAIAPRPLGEGVSCLGPGARRLYSRYASAGGGLALPATGDPSIAARSSSLGDPIPAGTTRFYQLQYQDASRFYCGFNRNGLGNVSSGIAISWAP